MWFCFWRCNATLFLRCLLIILAHVVIKQTVSALIFLPHNINISSSNNLIVWISEKLSEISSKLQTRKNKRPLKQYQKISFQPQIRFRYSIKGSNGSHKTRIDIRRTAKPLNIFIDAYANWVWRTGIGDSIYGNSLVLCFPIYTERCLK